MEASAQMPTELVVLAWGVVLVLVQLVLHTVVEITELGTPYALSPRDEGRHVKGPYGARINRAFNNLLETFVLFAALALALAVTGKAGGIGAIGAWLWFAARVLFVPAYVAGVAGVRTLLWVISMVGIVMMLLRLAF
jgi:uncharacterized MAPEG superfamily protein